MDWTDAEVGVAFAALLFVAAHMDGYGPEWTCPVHFGPYPSMKAGGLMHMHWCTSEDGRPLRRFGITWPRSADTLRWSNVRSARWMSAERILERPECAHQETAGAVLGPKIRP